jgi:amidophosphoribosyltransferase
MCAIFGIFHAPKAAELTVIGLHGNQHRAIDYAGIVTTDGEHFYRERGAGLARQVFTREMLDRLHGQSALGHLRYPTVSDIKNRDNIQPVLGIYNGRPIAIAHNGNITNTAELATILGDPKLATSLDTEFIQILLNFCFTGNIERDLAKVASMLQGSFSLGILLPDRLIALRDKSGNRPLSIGALNGGFCISSETCALNTLGATDIQDVEAGTMVTIDSKGLSVTPFAEKSEQKCRFEAIYYAHPGSKAFGEGVARFRMTVGETLETLFPVNDADIVTPIPDSSSFIAMGFGNSGRSGRYFPVITRSHYVGRTFIAATQSKRDEEVAQKFTFTASEIEGRNIVVVDDSIVRGTTLPKIVGELKRLGARKVHIRIGSPPIRYSCKYGINTPTTAELIAATRSSDQIRQQVGADSLEFLPLDVLKGLSPEPSTCMDGRYW